MQKRDDLYSSHSSRKVSTTLLKPNHQAGYLRHITQTIMETLSILIIEYFSIYIMILD
jgi:hypothetical protein